MRDSGIDERDGQSRARWQVDSHPEDPGNASGVRLTVQSECNCRRHCARLYHVHQRQATEDAGQTEGSMYSTSSRRKRRSICRRHCARLYHERQRRYHRGCWTNRGLNVHRIIKASTTAAIALPSSLRPLISRTPTASYRGCWITEGSMYASSRCGRAQRSLIYVMGGETFECTGRFQFDRSKSMQRQVANLCSR